MEGASSLRFKARRSTLKRCIVAQEWRFWRGTNKRPYVGHAGTSDRPPFPIQDGPPVVVATKTDSDATSVTSGTRPEL
jgi:hypothetical protein